jgi:hypothetical protein
MAQPLLLICKDDFTGYVDIARNLSEEKLAPRILEAQNFDLKPQLGEALYQDMLKVIPLPDNYKKLMGGDGFYQGLIPAMVYFTAARLVRRIDLHITPNAIMQKRNEFSDHVDYRDRNATATEFENIALAYLNEAVQYIKSKGPDIYPLWPEFAKCNTGDRVGYRPRIYGIGGRDTNGY